jgi:hypothetical protein
VKLPKNSARVIAGPALFLLALTACAQSGNATATTESATSGSATSESATSGSSAPLVEGVVLLPEEPPPRGASQFSTDFSRHTVPFRDILSGGVPKDGIPPIDNPTFISAGDADGWLEPTQPVLVVEAGGAAKAYPLQVLTRHEIVNDEVGGIPITVTYCPLCNTGIAFEREFDGHVLDFGVSGNLRYSNLIMWDRQTESWWQQATGDGIAGEYAGQRLQFHPVNLVAWSDFIASHPNGEVLRGSGGRLSAYGANPYAGYDTGRIGGAFLYRGPTTPSDLYEMARILTIDAADEAVAYPFQVLEEVHAVNDTVAGSPVAVFWKAGANSALDAPVIAQARDVGSAVAYSRILDGQTLDFEWDGTSFRDTDTRSTWNLLGESTGGQRSGKKLTPVVAVNHLWFSWYAFRPETRVFRG